MFGLLDNVKHTEDVIHREDNIFASNEEDLLQWYRAISTILEEDLHMQLVDETRAETWETLPFKRSIEARKEKDPYTTIVVDLSLKVKTPLAFRQSSDDLLKVAFVIDGKVEYDFTPRRREKTLFHDSVIYKIYANLVRNMVYTSKEEQKLEEECEELVLYIMDRLRDLQGSVETIGRSKREFFKPHYRT